LTSWYHLVPYQLVSHPLVPWRLFLGPVPRPDFSAAIRRRFAHAQLEITDEAITTILDLAEDVPYNVQALAHVTWDLAREGRTAKVMPAQVRRARTRLITQDDPFYSKMWTQLTPTQQKALIAAIRAGGRGLQSKTVTQTYGVAPSTMRKSLRTLEDREILRQEHQLGDTRWRLEDPFFGAWVETAQTR
jgi:uncharacterized protein